MEFMMSFRYSRSAMTGAAIFTLAGVTVLPLAQANAAPASPQDEARSGATQGQPNSAAQNGQDQGQQQGASANAQGQQGANAGGQGQQAQGAPASQSSSNSKSASQNNQSRQSQPSAPAKQSSGYATITSVDGFIDPQKTDNSLSVGITGVDNTHRIISDLRVQELDEFGNIVNDDVNTVGGASSNDSEGNLGISVVVDGTKINPNHHYRLYLDVFDQDTLTRSYAYYPVVVWNRSYIPVVPLSAAQ
ncbi:hypothetical protein HMPREF2625_03280 [Rothia sp. HMSC064D08]|uniref:hypothetical protein n=1 Tax=Rothia sp. HMSC064D08 TaxID=1715104 RepID=UPI0008A23F8C|nr:hypothetical protein [Rothia sp. HMSC064D08]OFN03405.1 hypothetical protein HMPREF2625_03280 [Rothia sp. HMSC064D08]